MSDTIGLDKIMYPAAAGTITVSTDEIACERRLRNRARLRSRNASASSGWMPLMIDTANTPCGSRKNVLYASEYTA